MDRTTSLATCFLAVTLFTIAPHARADDPLPTGAIARLGTNLLRASHTVSALAFSFDGKLLVSAGWDRTARVWDVATGLELARFTGHKDGASAIAISPDGKLVASGDMKRAVVLWDARSGKELKRTEDNANTAFWLRFTADGKRLIWAADKRVRVWDVATWRAEREIGVGEGVRPVVLSPDGKTLALGCNSGVIKIHNIDDGALVSTLEGHGKMIFGLAYNADGSRLVSGASDGSIRVWDVPTGQTIHAVTTSSEWVKPVAFLEGGKRFAGAGQDGSVRVWDSDTGKEAARFRVSARTDLWIMAMATSPDGKVFATAGTEKAIRLWDAKTLKPIGPSAAVDGHSMEIGSVAFVEGGRRIVTASEDGRVLLWDAKTGAKAGEIGDRALVGLALAASADGKSVAVCSESPSLELWDPATRKRTVAVQNDLVAMHAIAMSNDGATVATACRHSLVRVIDGQTGADRFNVKIDPRLYEEVPLAFSPDGRLLAIGSGDVDKVFVSLFDATNGDPIGEIAIRAGGYRSVAFSPDGAMMAFACRGRPISLVEVQSGKPRGTIEGDADAGTCIAFSPDGRLIAAGGGPDKPSVRVWAIATGKQVARFTGHKGWLKQVAFSPDSSRLASASEDTTALVWDVSRLGRDVAADEVDADALGAAWASLGDADAAKAYAAVTRLATARGAGDFLATRLTDAAAKDSASFAQLIVGLNADTYAEREAAGRALSRHGESARASIRAALEKEKLADEVRTRLSAMLKQMDRPTGASPDKLRVLRAVEAMERAGATDALKRLAKTDGLAGERAWAALARTGG